MLGAESPGLHRALFLDGSRKVRLGRASRRPLAPGEVGLRVLVAGFCGTDRQMISGARACQASVLGHECVAVVESVGSSVASVSSGELVTVNPVNPERPDQVVGHSIDGCFQEWFAADAALVRQGRLVPVPRGLPLTVAALAEPLATIVYGFQLIEPALDSGGIAIFGAGPIGLMICLLARLRGIPRILLVYNRQSRFEWAVSRGIRMAAAVNRVRAANCCGMPAEGKYLRLPADQTRPPILVTGHRGTSAEHVKASLRLLRAHSTEFARVPC
jgi:threonine dehydrogenase-like Zn-dependent dehydrogenase